MNLEASPRVLFVPRLERAGTTSERSPMMLRILQAEFPVTEISGSRFMRYVYDQRKSKLGRYLLFPFDEAALFWRTLLSLRRSDMLVFAEGSLFALPAAFAAKLRRRPLIWDNHGNVKTFALALGKSWAFTEANIVMERSLASMSAAVLVVSEKDKLDYASLGFPTAKFEVVPTCADLSLVSNYAGRGAEARNALGIEEGEMVIFFFGTLSYQPNLEAAKYIANELAPEVRKSHPKAHFYVAGSGGPKDGLGPHVTLLGFVPDIHLWISAADVCISPVWSGVGILTKVVDMLSHAKPTIVSPLAVDGIPELREGENCLIGRDRKDFVRKLEFLLSNPVQAGGIGAAGRQLIAEKYSCAKMREHIQSLIHKYTEDHQVERSP